MPAVLNAADEVAVEAFLNRKLSFTGIPKTIGKVMDTHSVKEVNEPDDALDADKWSREEAKNVIEGIRSKGKVGG
jgi:1-deoxy-D-xylulose-5-phosphate reductoisomerase